MSVSIKVTGKERLFNKLKAAVPEIEREMKAAGEKSANELAAKARAWVPVRSGKLRDSIVVTGPGKQTPPYSQPGGSMTVPSTAHAVTVGNTDVRYGHLVEYGAGKAPAQPFFWPAYRLYRRRFTGRFTRAMNKAIKKHSI